MDSFRNTLVHFHVFSSFTYFLAVRTFVWSSFTNWISALHSSWFISVLFLILGVDIKYLSEWKVQQWSNIRFRLLYVVELDCDDCWITMATMHCPAGSTPRVGGDQGWSLFVHAITHHNHSYHYKHYIASNFHGRESNQTVIGFDKHYFLQHLIYVCKSSINIEQKVFA